MLADLVHTSSVNISRYEREETAPNPDTLRLLTLALGTTSDYLLSIPEASASVKARISPEFSKLMEETADFSKEETVRLLEYAQLLKKGR